MGGEEDVVADDVAVVESNADPCAVVESEDVCVVVERVSDGGKYGGRWSGEMKRLYMVTISAIFCTEILWWCFSL